MSMEEARLTLGLELLIVQIVLAFYGVRFLFEILFKKED